MFRPDNTLTAANADGADSSITLRQHNLPILYDGKSKRRPLPLLHLDTDVFIHPRIDILRRSICSDGETQ